MHDKELVRGTLQTIILQLLKNNGEMYGYEISQKVKELSDGKILVTEGALYPALHKLESEGWLTIRKEKNGKRVRKYYSLTDVGYVTVSEKIETFRAFINTMYSVLEINAV
ncbi:MAG: helix-turn-helix transcriptional regulator [Cyclobacteriaceae bacterium]